MKNVLKKIFISLALITIMVTNSVVLATEDIVEKNEEHILATEDIIEKNEEDTFATEEIKEKNEEDTLKTEKENKPKEQTIDDGNYVIRSAVNNKYVLDIAKGVKVSGGNLQIYEYQNLEQQKYKVTYVDKGYYEIQALHSGMVLDVANAGKTAGTNVWQCYDNNSDAQRWTIKESETSGYYYIVSKCNGLYLDVANGIATNGNNISVCYGNNSNAQKFKFEKCEESKPEVEPEPETKPNPEPEETKKEIVDGKYIIKSRINNSYSLDICGGSETSGANLQIYQYQGLDQQIYNVKNVGNGYYEIQAVHSGMVLDVANAGKTAGTNVWQCYDNDSDAQRWTIKESEEIGYYYIVSKCNGLYLDVANGIASNGNNIAVCYGNNSKAQKFKFEKYNPNFEEGAYVIESAISSNYALDVWNGSKVSGANVQLYQKASSNRQTFRVIYSGDGFYEIPAAHSGMVLDVANAGKTAGTNVWQCYRNNSDAQKWIIQESEVEGYYYIISKCNGLYLDVANGKAANGTNIAVCYGNNSKAQKFKFVETDILYEQGIYGKSGLAVKGDSRGSDLKYYKFGQGENVMFATFSIHGFEDSFAHDGRELTYIAKQFATNLSNSTDTELLRKWTIYILPMLNPDGQTYGTTNNGEGRTTLYSAAPNNKGIDMNRNFQTSDYITYKDDRNYNGTAAFQAYEARYLRDFLLNNKSQKGQTILIDLHGWLEETMGDNELGKYYRNEFGLTKHISTYGRGYLINWARMSLGNSNKVARTAIVELPQVNSHEQLVSERHAEKYIDATIKMLKSLI